MFYNTPSKGDDGLYFVQASTDDKRKCLVQLNNVTVSEVSGDMVFDVNSDASTKKINDIEVNNLRAAHENCVEWFGKQLSEKVVSGAYRSVLNDDQITADVITDHPVRVFNTNQESADFESIQAGKKCDIILEFAGLWFAKKAFGGHWNVVQVRLHDEIVKEDSMIDQYPEEYAFVDEPVPEPEPESDVNIEDEPESPIEPVETQKMIKERIDILTK
tara:strand:- start:3345 stop:3995 length:651 start_codon:yes stop_codon:yes gene_type:complete